jgi:hypothetical protein
MGPSQLAVNPHPTISPVSAPRRGGPSRPAAFGRRGLGLLAFAAICAVVGYLLRPGAVTDDTYAFLDWGRDLRHGFLPLLEHRTFQPLPIVAGAVVSLFGSAAPTITVMICLAGLVLLAAASWRVVALLGFGQPAPALAASLVLLTPLLPILALVAYNNLPFATLLLWALVFELEQRRTGAWALLILAGLTRPEAWLFLLAYGILTWWRAGHPYAPRRWLPIAALALGPLALWAGLEWRLFGDPLYSLHSTTGPAVQSTHTNSPQALWNNLRAYVPTAPLVASGFGVIALAWFAPRRLAATTLAATALAILSILVLASSNFNVPGRDFSVLVPLVCVLAAAGAMLPARVLSRSRGSSAPAAVVLAALCAALVIGLAASRSLSALRSNFKNISIAHDTGRTFTRDVTRALPLIEVRGAPRHSIAMVGAVEDSELAWVLGVPFNAVVDQIERQTRLIVQPSPATWELLKRYDLTNRTREPIPRGWHVIANGDWQIYAASARTPARLHSGDR